MGGQMYKKRQEGVAAYQNHQSCEPVMLIHLERSSFTPHPTPPPPNKTGKSLRSVLGWTTFCDDVKGGVRKKKYHIVKTNVSHLVLPSSPIIWCCASAAVATQRCLILRAKAPPSFGNMPICSCLTKSESTFLIFWFLISAWTQWNMRWLILGLY